MAAAWVGLIFVDIDMDPPPEPDTAATDEYIGLPGIPRYQKQVIVSATAFLCFYVGTEVAYGGLIYTFAVEDCLLGVAAASDLTASYWGSFALGRLLAIPLSTWFSPGLMLGCSLGVAGSAIGLIVLFSDAVWAAWVGTFIFGLGMAASFPTAFTMLSEQVDVTGKIATLVIVGSAFGEMTIPWIIAERMDGRPEAFIGGIAAAVVGSVVVFVWFWMVGNRRRAIHWNEVTRRALLSQDADTEEIVFSSPTSLELTQRVRSRNDVHAPT
jgi:fucose permease